MKDINEAYEKLIDPEKRKLYDSTWVRRVSMRDTGRGPILYSPKTADMEGAVDHSHKERQKMVRLSHPLNILFLVILLIGLSVLGIFIFTLNQPSAPETSSTI
jgi:curved DNA-binding protein CbpA